MRLIRGPGVVGALGKVNLPPTLFADVFPIEFIGEYFYFHITMLTFTEKRLEIPELFKTGAMAAWSIHWVRLPC